MSEQYWGSSDKMSEANFSPAETLVTDRNTKLCCRAFVLALFQSTTANKIDSEHTRDYTKVFSVCKVEN